MKARPWRRVWSTCTGALTEPRREETRATSPSAKPESAASSGERSSVSGRRIGVP